MLFFFVSFAFFIWVIVPLFFSLSPSLFASPHTSRLDRVLGCFLSVIMFYSLFSLCLFFLLWLIRSQSLMVAPVSYNNNKHPWCDVMIIESTAHIIDSVGVRAWC
jgi:hypothetical protein